MNEEDLREQARRFGDGFVHVFEEVLQLARNGLTAAQVILLPRQFIEEFGNEFYNAFRRSVDANRNEQAVVHGQQEAASLGYHRALVPASKCYEAIRRLVEHEPERWQQNESEALSAQRKYRIMSHLLEVYAGLHLQCRSLGTSERTIRAKLWIFKAKDDLPIIVLALYPATPHKVGVTVIVVKTISTRRIHEALSRFTLMFKPVYVN